MSTENKSGSSAAGGASGLTLLQIAFIVLKLCNVIRWKWLWVLAPTWIPILILIIFLVIMFLLRNR